MIVRVQQTEYKRHDAKVNEPAANGSKRTRRRANHARVSPREADRKHERTNEQGEKEAQWEYLLKTAAPAAAAAAPQSREWRALSRPRTCLALRIKTQEGKERNSKDRGSGQAWLRVEQRENSGFGSQCEDSGTNKTAQAQQDSRAANNARQHLTSWTRLTQKRQQDSEGKCSLW